MTAGPVAVAAGTNGSLLQLFVAGPGRAAWSTYEVPGGVGSSTTTTGLITGVSPDGRSMIDQNGNPVLVNGDTPWDLAWALDATDQQTYLADRAKDGFNVIATDLVGSAPLHGNANGANYAGDLPFLGSNFTPNPAYWSKIDTFFRMAAQDGISVVALPIDAYATVSGNVFQSMTDTQAQSFGAFLAARYPASSYPGIVWMLGNDYSGDGAGQGTDGFLSQYQALVTGLKSTSDPRPITAENGYWDTLATDGATLGRSYTLNFVYDYHPTYEGVLRAWTTKNLPVLFFEGAYENAISGFPSTPLDLRKEIGWSLTSGATGNFYGNDDGLWWFASGWQNLLDTADVNQRQAMYRAFAGIDWSHLQPDTSSRLVTAGRNNEGFNFSAAANTPETNDSTYGWYVTAAYTPDGRTAVIYNPDTSRNHITVSSVVLGSDPTITAVDPTTGATTNLGWTSTPTMGANAGGDDDWLFVIHAG